MATWYGTSALDALLNEIKNNAATLRLLDNYTQGDSFATVDTNTIASVAIDSSDFTGPEQSIIEVYDRRLTFNGKTAVASASSSVGQLHVAICSVDSVLSITDETSDQPITASNSVNVPIYYMESAQPTQV